VHVTGRGRRKRRHLLGAAGRATGSGSRGRRTRRWSATTLVAGSLLVAGCGGAAPAAAPTAATGNEVTEAVVVVHKTETCTCCGAYEEYLAAQGYTVDVRIHDDIAAVKTELGVPPEEQSCHTNEVAGYVVEGHVPTEAIEVLLAEAPDVDGISLVGMPSGSPGMPGEQTEPFVVRTFVDGEVTGELGRF
jgi:hypothetical protein